jgi:protein gp37
MAENSHIEWTDHTFNPWEGCQKVGPGCDNCYAEARDIRFTGGAHWGPGAPRRRTSVANWLSPVKWNRDAAVTGTRPRVFCASLADVFDNAVDPAWRADLWRLTAATPHLDWLLLTKRPQNIINMLPDGWGDGWPNVWLGCTVVNQAEADRDVPKLLSIPAAVRFLSVEPMLGPVDLRGRTTGTGGVDALTGWVGGLYGEYGPCINWVICGGESGPHARPMHPDWARSLRDQCKAAGVAFFFKQWGQWGPALQMDGTTGISAAPARDGNWAHPHRRRIHGGPLDGQCFESLPDHHDMLRVGKRAAGRNLDGCEYNELPGGK